MMLSKNEPVFLVSHFICLSVDDWDVCRYVKGGGKLVGDQSAPVVTGAGTFDLDEVASLDKAIEGDLVKAISNGNNKQAEKLVDDVVLEEAQPKAVTAARPTFRDRIVGAGYKQVS